MLIALAQAVGARRITDQARKVLDLNHGSKVDVQDVTMLLRRTVGNSLAGTRA